MKYSFLNRQWFFLLKHIFFFPLSPTRPLANLTMSTTTSFLYETGTAYLTPVPGFTRFSVGSVLVTLCVCACMRVLCQILPVSQDCQFSIPSSDFSNVFLYIIKHFGFLSTNRSYLILYTTDH